MSSEKVPISHVLLWAGSNSEKWEMLDGSTFSHKTLGRLRLKEVRLPYLTMVGNSEDGVWNVGDLHEWFQFSIPVENCREKIHQFCYRVKATKASLPKRQRENAAENGQWLEGKFIQLDLPRTKQNLIRDVVKRRQIEALYHFTPIVNLQGILEEGLLPRSELKRGHEGAAPLFNDDNRADRCKDASCCTVGFPNYKLFYSFQMKDQSRIWAVISLDPSVLWTNTCLFNETNAANTRCSTIPRNQRMTVDALEGMFSDSEHQTGASGQKIGLRTHLRLSDFMTTDPQAEVLVIGRVSVTSISRVVFKCLPDQREAERQLPSQYRERMSFKVDTRLFDSRCDSKYWENPKQRTCEHVGADLYDEIPF